MRLPLMVASHILDGGATTASIGATTTGAEVVSIAKLTVSAGNTVTVSWGDGLSDTYSAGGGARTHNYAGAGTWNITFSNPTAITKLTLNNNKLTVNSASLKNMTNMLEFNANACEGGRFDSADVSAWRPTTFYLRNMPAGYAITASAGGFAGWVSTTNFRVDGNALSSATVTQILADFWSGFATRTATAGTIDVGGSNQAPSGNYQAANPPDEGKEYAYELLNDSQNVNPTKKWATVAFTA